MYMKKNFTKVIAAVALGSQFFCFADGVKKNYKTDFKSDLYWFENEETPISIALEVQNMNHVNEPYEEYTCVDGKKIIPQNSISSYIDEYGYKHFDIDDNKFIVIDNEDGAYYNTIFYYKGDSIQNDKDFIPRQIFEYKGEGTENWVGAEVFANKDLYDIAETNGYGIRNIRASSTLTDKYHTYSPENVLTCYSLCHCWNKNNIPWVEGVSGDGIGESIEFDVTEDEYFSTSIFHILNGYVDPLKPWLFKQNNRIKKAKVEITNNVDEVFCYDLNFNDVVEFTTFRTSDCIRHVKITILEVYKGTKYSDTCISAIGLDLD